MSALTKSVAVDRIEVDASGVVSVRLACRLEAEGVAVLDHWHRVCIPPGASVDEAFAAVNQHLTRGIVVKGALTTFPPVNRDGVETVRAYANVAHTPERIEAYRAAMSATLAQ